MIKSKIVLISLAISLLAACGESVVQKQPPHLQALINTEEYTAHQMALNLYDGVAIEADRKNQGNFVFSPTSIAMGLGMLHAGANGTTREEIERLLVPAGNNPAPVMLQQLADSLSMRSERAEENQAAALDLVINNTVWLAPELQPWPAYLEEVAESYQAESHLLDFLDAPEAARLTINDAVFESTNGLIKDFLQAGSVTSNTQLILTNTVYFNGRWLNSFSESGTGHKPFYNLDQPASDVETMHGICNARYHRYENAQVVAIPYSNAAMEMVVIVPDEGQFKSVEAGLDSTTLSQLMSGLAPAGMTVQLPKFSLDHSLDLQPVLQSLGISAAFSASNADFSRLSAENLHVGLATHKAAIEVEEHGTEAAAATAFGMIRASLPTSSITVDRPFIFGIYDRPTDTFLFLGRVLSL